MNSDNKSAPRKYFIHEIKATSGVKRMVFVDQEPDTDYGRIIPVVEETELDALKQKLDEANKLLIRAESWIGPHAQLGQLGAAIWFEDLLRYRKDEDK